MKKPKTRVTLDATRGKVTAARANGVPVPFEAGSEPGTVRILDDLIPLLHLHAENFSGPGCGKPALWATERPVLGAMPDLKKLLLADGSRPIAGAKAKCASCGVAISPADVAPEGGWATPR